MSRFNFKLKSLLSSELELYEGPTQIGWMNNTGWQSRVSFVIDGRSYAIQSDQDLIGAYVLLQGDDDSTTVVTRAEVPGIFTSGFRVVHHFGVLVLKSNGFIRRKCILTVDGEPQGNIQLNGILGQRGAAVLPDGLPRSLQMFFIALAFRIWREDDASA